MAIYRALARLDAGPKGIFEAGDLFPGNLLGEHTCEILESRGKIALASTPPLSALPGWKTRAGKFPAGTSAGDFLEAATEELAVKMRVKPDRIEAWKTEVLGWLKAPKPRGG
jgi:hypothetical protein